MGTLAESFDYRKISTACPVARMVVPVTILDGATNGQTKIGFSGRIKKLKYDVPDMTGVATLQVDLLDEDGTSLYQKSGIAENAISVYDVSMVAAGTPHGIVFAGTLTIKCTASTGAQTGDQLIKVVLIYD